MARPGLAFRWARVLHRSGRRAIARMPLAENKERNDGRCALRSNDRRGPAVRMGCDAAQDGVTIGNLMKRLPRIRVWSAPPRGRKFRWHISTTAIFI